MKFLKKAVAFLAEKLKRLSATSRLVKAEAEEESDNLTIPPVVVSFTKRAMEMREAAYQYQQLQKELRKPKAKPGPRPGSKEWRLEQARKQVR